MGERTPLAVDRRAGVGPHGGRRGDHQPAGRADRARRASSCRRNWMAACGEPGEDAALYDTVQAVGMELCPALGISHPGRQGFAVDAHALERRRRGEEGDVAGVA